MNGSIERHCPCAVEQPAKVTVQFAGMCNYTHDQGCDDVDCEPPARARRS